MEQTRAIKEMHVKARAEKITLTEGWWWRGKVVRAMETGSVSSSWDYANKPRYANTHTRIGHTLALARRIAQNSRRRPHAYIARANKIPAGNAGEIYGRVISNIVSRARGVIHNREKARNEIKRIDCRVARSMSPHFTILSTSGPSGMSRCTTLIIVVSNSLYACLSLNYEGEVMNTSRKKSAKSHSLR